MPGFGGLNHHLAAFRTASGTARHLHHQLKSPFGGPEIGVIQQVVGIEDAHERHPREVETLGDHLRTDQNVGPAGLEIGDNGIESPFGGHTVAVQTSDTRFGEDFGDLFLDLLRPETHRNHVGDLARRTFRRNGLRIAAVVADEFLSALVVGQRHIAVRTAGCPAAFGALDIG